MIRACCGICREAIVHVAGQKEGREAATGPCGHVFHRDCLTTWIFGQKTTCPTCRQKINKPIVLYFDEESVHEESSDEDPAALRDQLENLKGIVKKRDEEKDQLLTEKKQIQDSFQSLKTKCSNTEKKLSSEKSITAALKKQMMFLKKQEMEVAEAKKEATTSRQELKKYERLQVLVEGNKDDAETMLNGLRDEGRAAQEMVTQLVILKKELEKIRESRNKARENKEKFEREISRLKHELSTKEIEYQKTNEQLILTESDLTRTEKENASLRKKVSKLEQAFNSPSPRSSAITRLMLESPAPLELKRPRLTPPDEETEEGFLAQNEYSASQESGRNNETEMQTAAREMGLHLVKTTTFNTNPVKPTNQRHPLMPIQPRKRRADYDSGPSFIRKGYDGMGGHAKFLKPSKLTTKGHPRKVARPNNISKFIKTTKDGKEPPLPVMTLDFD